MPIPDGNKTRAAYGKVIIGNNILVTVLIPFKSILPLSELIVVETIFLDTSYYSTFDTLQR